MTSIVPVVLIGWLLVSLALYALLDGRRATIVCVLGGALLLPVTGFRLPGLPDYTKQTAVALGALLGTALFHRQALFAFRPKWFDVPILVLTTCSLLTSLSNDLGWYDGLSTVFTRSMLWLLPYLLGRLYFTKLEHMRELAVGLAVAGLLYAPLCLFEIRMSPTLHRWIYGFHSSQFSQQRRFGGFRPTVFMGHGLAVALFMSYCTLAVAWLWRCKARVSLLGIPAPLICAALLVTTVLCKSLGPVLLLGAGFVLLAFARRRTARLAMFLLLAFPVCYAAFRATGTWTFESGVDTIETWGGTDRAGSLRVRLNSENVLIDRTYLRPWLGWGGWSRNRPEDSKDLLTDGLWVITFSQNGILGITSLLAALLIPPWLAVRRIPSRLWLHPVAGGAVLIAVLLTLFATDCLFNAGPIPYYVLALGALAGSVHSLRLRSRAARRHGRRTQPRLVGAPRALEPAPRPRPG